MYRMSRKRVTTVDANFRGFRAISEDLWIFLDVLGARIGGGGGNRTRVRKHYATGHYMLSPFFVSRRALPEGQGRREASFSAF
jgi:hypothetical protein